jgi:hypothetical protein
MRVSPTRQRRPFGQQIEALAVDEKVRGAQPPAALAQPVRPSIFGQHRDVRPVHDHVFDNRRAQVAVVDRQQRAAVREGEAHRRMRVGHPG